MEEDSSDMQRYTARYYQILLKILPDIGRIAASYKLQRAERGFGSNLARLGREDG